MMLGIYKISNTDFLRSYKPETVEKVNFSKRYFCDALIWNNNYDFHSSMLESFPNLKLFINWGTDDANLKDEEVLQKKVSIKKVDFYAQQSICEYVLMLMIAFEHAQEKNHVHKNHPETRQLYGKKIGIVGLGKIGFGVANLLHGSFGCTVLYSAPKEYGIPEYHFASPEELMRVCDYVIITVKSRHCRLDPAILGAANKNLVILNISRDSVLPLVYIYPYVREHRIRGFIGDVASVDVEKAVMKNIAIAPKSGYQTEEAIKMKRNIALFYLKQYQLREHNKKSYVYIARHAKTEWNALKIYQGTLDSFLSSEGKNQAEKIGGLLASRIVKTIFSSPLGRTRQTAEIIARRLHKPVLTVPAFREMHFGVFQGKSQERVKELFDDFFTSRRENSSYKLFVPYPGGESYYDVYLRILSAVLELLVTSDNFLIVGHESVNRMIRGIILGKPLTEMVNVGQKNNELVLLEMSENAESSTFLNS